MAYRLGIKPIVGTAVGAVCLLMLGLAYGGAAGGSGIAGSKHDFAASAATYNNEICIVCHTPHGSSTDPKVVGLAPLWNHALTNATYSVYTSPTFDPRGGLTITQPDGVSLLCLSCHDGTVAVDAYKAPGNWKDRDDWNSVGTGGLLRGSAQYIAPNSGNFQSAFVGTDLRNDHPIAFTYDATLAALDPELVMPQDANQVDAAGKLLLYNGKMQCATCHDVHNKGDPQGAYLLRIANSNLSGGQPSGLCLACHSK